MSSLPITFALFALSAAENASVNQNKNLIAGSHRINNSGEEIIQYKRGGQMAVAPHGVLKENAESEGCVGKNWWNCLCASEDIVEEPYGSVLLPPGGWLPNRSSKQAKKNFANFPAKNFAHFPELFKDEPNTLPTSFNIPVQSGPYTHTPVEDMDGNMVDIREPTFFKKKWPHVAGADAEVELVEVSENQSPEFVYLPYIPSKISCINMANRPQLAVLSDMFTGCWMNTVKSESGQLERVCHVGTTDNKEMNRELNDWWNKYAKKNPGKIIRGFKPSDAEDICLGFLKTQNMDHVDYDKPKQLNMNRDIFGLVSKDQFYTLLVPRGAIDGKNTIINGETDAFETGEARPQTIPTSYLLRWIPHSTLDEQGKIDLDETPLERRRRTSKMPGKTQT